VRERKKDVLVSVYLFCFMCEREGEGSVCREAQQKGIKAREKD